MNPALSARAYNLTVRILDDLKCTTPANEAWVRNLILNELHQAHADGAQEMKMAVLRAMPEPKS